MGGGWDSEAESQLLPTFTAFPRKKTNTHTQADSVPKPTTLVPRSVSLDRGMGGEGLASVSQMKCPHSSSNFSPAPSLVVQGALAKCHQPQRKEEKRAVSSPAGHRHLHACGRDGGTQLVQVSDACGAGVAAVHFEGRRGALVPSPHPNCGGLSAARSELPTDGKG